MRRRKHIHKSQSNLSVLKQTLILFLGRRGSTNDLEFSTTLNDDWNHFFYHPVQVGIKYRIRVQQTYKSNGLYQYTVFMNDEQIHTAENTKARQFYNMHVYLSISGETPCDATVSNFKITNFL